MLWIARLVALSETPKAWELLEGAFGSVQMGKPCPLRHVEKKPSRRGKAPAAQIAVIPPPDGQKKRTPVVKEEEAV